MAGLKRHCREVHGSKLHYCPFRSCNRHTRGFARKYNLLQHQAHCHGDGVSAPQFGSSQSSQTESLEYEDELTQARRSPSEDTDRESETQGVFEATHEPLGGGDRLVRKLRDLKAKRDRINRKIATLESAQPLMGTSSS